MRLEKGMFVRFADPLPDELFYSAIARSGDRSRYPSKTALVQEIFNVKSLTAVIDLPTHLDDFVQSLPTGHSYTSDILIDKHTLLPFYGPFLPKERLEYLRKDMHGNGGVHSRAALLKSSIPPLQWLRFCPACFEEDRKQFGVGYWHRIHQLPGIKVCPQHKVFLEDSTAKARNRSHPSEFISAEKAIRNVHPEYIDVNRPTHTFLLNNSLQASWLLNQDNLSSDINDLHNRYQVLLIRQGYRNYRGFLDMSELLRAFKNYYPEEFLEFLHCELDGHIGNWIFRVVRSKKAQHPILHILLMNFLGCNAEEFFKVPTKYAPFGGGPWPCLNSTCEYYQQLRIKNYILKINPKSKRPVGVFICECGFKYCRNDPENCEPHTMKISKIISYGHVWEAKLKELWLDRNFSLNQIAQQLNVSTTTLRNHAIKLKLMFPRFRGRNKGMLSYSVKRKWIPSPALVDKQRIQWLTALNENPTSGLSIIRYKTRRLYTWLLAHDGDWLNKHLPAEVIEKIEPQTTTNWEELDAQLAVKIREAGVNLRSIPGSPQRIKRDTIGRYIDQKTAIRKEIHRLPLTAKALAEVVETPIMFVLRRLNWAAELFIHDKIIPTRKQLIRQANIWSYENLPEVKEAIEKTLHMLHELAVEQK